MKVWVTDRRFGTFLLQADMAWKQSGDVVSVYIPLCGVRNLWRKGENWHDNYEDAVKRAEELRDETIADLKKQIAKLEALRFT